MSLPLPPQGPAALGVTVFQYQMGDGSAYTIDHGNKVVYILEPDGTWNTTGTGDYQSFCNSFITQQRAAWGIALVQANTQPPLVDYNGFTDTQLSSYGVPPVDITI